MSDIILADVAIIGAGVAGLMLAKKLSSIGIKTILIERNSRLAQGTSTRNEGWLHRGTYHAISIKDRVTAMQVARRCIYGHEQIRTYAPEVCEDIDLPAYALVGDKNRIDEIVSRWDEAEVQYRAVRVATFCEDVPEVNLTGVSEIFQVKDIGINTRLLYRKLATDALRNGCLIFTDAKISFTEDHATLLLNSSEVKKLSASLFVHTSGYSTREFFQTHFAVTIPLRYWKSHLLTVPRLSRNSVFYLDPYQSAMMNHGDWSVVGLNEDAIICDAPSFDTVPANIELSLSALQRLFKVTNLPYLATACIKVDLVEKANAFRSLNISIAEPLPNHLCVLPGKMTETPYVTDVVSRLVYDRLTENIIAMRPFDDWHPSGQL